MSEGLILLGVLFAIVLTIVWLLLPFAVFGLKPRLDEAIAEQKKTNAWLAEIATQSREPKKESSPGRHISFEHPE